MALSSRSITKFSLSYIFKNFGKIWLLIAKMFAAILLLVAVAGGIGVSMIGMDTLSKMAPKMSLPGMNMNMPITSMPMETTLNSPLNSLPAVELMEDSMTDSKADPNGGDQNSTAMPNNSVSDAPLSREMSNEMAGDLGLRDVGTDSNDLLSMTTGIIAGFLGLASFIFLSLIGSAFASNIIQSVVFSTHLETAIFDRLTKKPTLRYFAAYLLTFLIGLIVVGICFALMQIHPMAALLGLLAIPLFLRLSLLPAIYCIGNVTSLYHAYELTRGKAWIIFKIIILSMLVIIGFALAFAALSTGILSISDTLGSMSGILTGAISILSLAVTVPLQQLMLISIAKLYKDMSDHSA